jgi:hypothetical protein
VFVLLPLLKSLLVQVAQFPHELITYGGNGSVFSNWCVSASVCVCLLALFDVSGGSEGRSEVCRRRPCVWHFGCFALRRRLLPNSRVPWFLLQGAVPPCHEVPVGHDRRANPGTVLRPPHGVRDLFPCGFFAFPVCASRRLLCTGVSRSPCACKQPPVVHGFVDGRVTCAPRRSRPLAGVLFLQIVSLPQGCPPGGCHQRRCDLELLLACRVRCVVSVRA